MTDAGPPGGSPVWRRVLARRRSRVLLALVLLIIMLRVALPSVLRRVVVAQADQAMIGRVEIDDVDLALLTGGFTVHGLRVFATEAPDALHAPATADVPPASPLSTRSPAIPPRAGEGLPGSAPVLSAKRLTVDLGFLALFRRIVEVQHVDLEEVAVSLDRATDGNLVLPAAAPTTEPAPEAEGPGWGVLIQSVILRHGRIGFRDFAVGDPPQHIEVALPTLDAGHLALLITESGMTPGTVTLDAGIQDGTLHLEVALESAATGPAYESHVVLTSVPVGDARLYIPKVGWSGLSGRLDADLVHRFESQGAHTLRGTIGVRELDVRVADLDAPALAWRTLAIAIAGVDFVAQHADITTVTVDGVQVVTRPTGPEPLPVLRGLMAVAADPEAAMPQTAEGVPAATVATAGAQPWSWAVAKAQVTDGHLHVMGGDGTLDVAVSAEAAPLASAAGTRTTAHLALDPASGGQVDLAGDLTLDPLAFDGKLRLTDLLLPPLTQPVATTATRALRGGIANLDLTIAAGATPNAPPDGLRLAGTIGLTDLAVAGDDPTVFALRWKQLAIAVSSLTAPGVLAPGKAATPAPIDVALGTLRLVRPELTVTRTADGIALPGIAGGSPVAAMPPTAAPAPARAPTAASPAATQAAPAVRVRADRVAIEKMRVVATDTAVKPFARSTLDPIDLNATDVRWPDPSVKDLKLVAKGLDGAVLTVTGTVAPARSRLVTKLTGLPLAPFNPYATSTGYGVAGGTAALESTITLGPGTYDTKSRMILNGLDVRAGEGDALFTSKFGMPLSLALALMTDLQGNIVIDLPITGDASGMRTGLGTLIGNALARAILNAVTSPLKLIGAVGRIGEKPASVTPQPIVFLAGREALADGEEQKLAPLGRLLGMAPGLRLHLRGEAGEADRRWLREQALRATLEKESGVVGSLRHIGERGPRTAVLAALTARAAGTPAEIPAEHQAWFETQVAARTVDEATLRQLAQARAASLQAQLASGQGVDATRLILDDPAAADPAARSVVAIGLGSPAPRAPAVGATVTPAP